MHSFLRLSLLGLFCAVGLAVAIGLATTLEPDVAAARGPLGDRVEAASEDQPAADAPTKPADAPPTEIAAGDVGEPVEADFHPAVAGQVALLERSVERAEQAAQDNRSLLRDVLSFRWNTSQPSSAPDDSSGGGGAPPPQPTAQPSPTLPEPESVPPQVSRDQQGDRVTINSKQSDIRQVLELLSQATGMNIVASPNVQGAVPISLTDVDVDTALDAILRASGLVAQRRGDMLYIGTPEDFKRMEQAAGRIATRIYRPNYVRASELNSLITPLLTEGVGTASVSSEALQGIAVDGTQVGGDDFANEEVLLVRDYEQVLAQVDQVVAEVDTRPRQVAIEAMILSIKLDDSHELGVDFELLRDNNNVRLVSGMPVSSLANISVQDGGLKFGFLDSSTAIFINALETVGDTNVIAAPHLMCLNKQRAEILIGAQLGYVQTTFTENVATQSVEFLEVGTQLRLRPYISADGMIRMEIHPELSTGQVRVEEGFTLPDKEVTQVTTNIMCQDGSTIVIGGLYREDLGATTTQIPILGNVPYFGALFRQTAETNDRREVVVLITPRIVYEPQMGAEGNEAAAKYLERQSVYADKMSPISKRYFGRRYYRLAHAAWVAGDACAALRYANLAIHFDPLLTDAVTLRREIVDNSPYGDRTVDTHLREGLMPWNHPHPEHQPPPWMYPELIQPEPKPPMSPEMYQPGPPTPTRTLQEAPLP